MNYYQLTAMVTEAYQAVADWFYSHQQATDILVGAVIIGSLLALFLMSERRRRRLHRIWWGVTMSRTKNRLDFEKMMLAFRIEEALFEMECVGEISEKSANEWRHALANQYGMTGLLPRKSKYTIKKGIKLRLKRGVHKAKPKIPEGAPPLPVDTSYLPPKVVNNEVGIKSKWAA